MTALLFAPGRLHRVDLGGWVSVGIPSEVRVTEPWAGLIRSLQSSGAGCGRGEVPPCLGVNRGPL